MSYKVVLPEGSHFDLNCHEDIHMTFLPHHRYGDAVNIQVDLEIAIEYGYDVHMKDGDIAFN